MKLKDIFLQNQTRRFNEFEKIKKEDVFLEMKPLKKLKQKWYIILIILIITIALLSLKPNIKLLAITIILILTLIGLFIFGNSAKLTCTKDFLKIKQGFQNTAIPYANLKSVYIAKTTDWLLFFPTYSYKIIIRCQDNFSFLREFHFSLLCANPEDVNNFINNFAVKNVTEQKFVKYEKRKLLRSIIESILTIGAVVFILVYLFKNGIISIFPII